jgi:hypothetical protein
MVKYKLVYRNTGSARKLSVSVYLTLFTFFTKNVHQLHNNTFHPKFQHWEHASRYDVVCSSLGLNVLMTPKMVCEPFSTESVVCFVLHIPHETWADNIICTHVLKINSWLASHCDVAVCTVASKTCACTPERGVGKLKHARESESECIASIIQIICWCFDTIFPPPQGACARFPSNGTKLDDVTMACKSWMDGKILFIIDYLNNISSNLT